MKKLHHLYLNNKGRLSEIISPLNTDENYDIRSIETYINNTPKTHKFDDISIEFDIKKKKINILFKKKNTLEAIEIARIKFLDPYFYSVKLKCNGKKLIYKENLSEDKIYNFLLFNAYHSNIITIVAEDNKSIEYSSTCITYKITKDREDAYYLNKTLDE